MTAGGDHLSDTLATTLTMLTNSPLGDVTVDHDMSTRLLDPVVRELYLGCRHKAEVILGLPATKSILLGLRLST